ncbi:MAG: hypothetical protein A3E02_01465 [Candidatus Zambryskibacteria bacterium RIFCSPHIGHO2_12_FULL_38_34]|uniref:Uncharacterized protein n=1 Tax=Candidatus Zambryskibacteria bacterium RIFCSPLOWO2_12_FULL_39_16 TaxID=1802775 RepID=A0A1G2UTF8_9BACT|nr:MAG: hypothetical protein A3D37_01255 [Candidatus Zambryskibacteria bacterium RIFCSPHIGHO2_02_FULL_38_22]OHA98682.1 MAG: hypothetical protein A3E02_01465 [Candidatus Zambryskibacteria bacterium RIFCSPHIGHO2_12_FULL_38_34]OHB08287.1 MAG: hypothetical protein A3I19_01560 [Candidatus Zambryskibacteria bacterium RIFCSPLOWO2_02_FULL_38_13]OHB12681.1 MAG: hypothetical protein A3G46_00615 [Candidatus Zambryskibacteria bacterium RIFCSPLOWO2_12_FULL_39_16]
MVYIVSNGCGGSGSGGSSGSGGGSGLGGGSGSGGGGNTSPIAPTITSISVVCDPTSLQVGQTSQCMAAVVGTGNYSSSINWITSIGSINSSGLFTASSTTGTVTVTATSVQDTNKNGSATVTVTGLPMVDVMAAPRMIAMVVDPKVTAVDTNGLVAKLAQTISGDYAAKAGVNDPVVSTTIIPSPADVLGVRAALQNVDHLWGVMLIGQVPAAWFLQDGLPTPTDWSYRVPNCSLYTVAGDGSLTNLPDGSISSDSACNKSAWSSRIYGTPDQVLAFIQKDLNTRHTSPNLKKYGYVRGGWFGGSVEEDHTQYWVTNNLYHPDDISYVINYESVDDTALSRLQDFKNLLAEGAEFVTLNTHGASTFITMEGAGVVGTFYSNDTVTLSSDNLLNLPNHARVINLVNCSTGNFFSPDYFAGAALFGGDTLLVHAFTPIMGIGDSYEGDMVGRNYHMLADGATFADIEMAPTWSEELFGDPTISLRPFPQTEHPILSISTDGVNFSRYHGPLMDLDVSFAQVSVGGAEVNQTITLRNDGTTNLALQFAWSFGQSGGGFGFFRPVDFQDPAWTNCPSNLQCKVVTMHPGDTLPFKQFFQPSGYIGSFISRTDIHTVNPRDNSLGSSDSRLGQIRIWLKATAQ